MAEELKKGALVTEAARPFFQKGLSQLRQVFFQKDLRAASPSWGEPCRGPPALAPFEAPSSVTKGVLGKAIKVKDSEYMKLLPDNRADFLPLACETFGGWSPEALDFFTESSGCGHTGGIWRYQDPAFAKFVCIVASQCGIHHRQPHWHDARRHVLGWT